MLSCPICSSLSREKIFCCLYLMQVKKIVAIITYLTTERACVFCLCYSIALIRSFVEREKGMDCLPFYFTYSQDKNLYFGVYRFFCLSINSCSLFLSSVWNRKTQKRRRRTRYTTKLCLILFLKKIVSSVFLT